ncbi:nodulation protein NodH [uncultured Litoreibacter sp.]|uniref:nodulation protein NodH n=1 Tax=uncultured Litoreibacter sp. TaxID=1392394 RepID=UPI00261DB7F6|nr:nodulation protein NodH [uncultured Litoreibacter sp.]
MEFEYFVVFAEMRTGSNFLEASLNGFEDLQCYGEIYNPHFVGHHNKDELFGIDLAQRETAPIALIERIKSNTDGIGGFRFFNDHDPRVMAHVLADPKCAKIVLTRNPLDSYVSLKIAAQTGQWKLSDVKQRRSAKVTFDEAEFLRQLADKRDFQLDILRGIQTSGQTAFYISYEDIGDTAVLNGIAQFIGSKHQIDAAAKSTKKQNPSDLEDKVTNYDEMVKALASIDHFGLSDTPNFEPRRGPGVPGFYTASRAPLLYIPIRSGPHDQALNWLAGVDAVGLDALQTGLSQKDLRQWKKQHPGHRAFSILRHPLARAHHVFCQYVVPKEDNNFQDPRRIMRNKYGVSVPKNGDLSGYSKDDHKVAFINFLKFLKGNLAGQTSVRIDAVWASQSSLLEAAAVVALPDVLIREDQAALQLSRLAEDLGLSGGGYQPAAADTPFGLADIYDAQLEKLCFQTYRKDYISFGFGDWSA